MNIRSMEERSPLGIKHLIDEKSTQIIEMARQVITEEAKAIHALKQQIDENFIKVCQLFYHCTGHIIMMGMGKSGYIAKKIAATFSSTGTPSFFIHPSEAKHGDIGMITSQDILFILSHSGETEEILSLIPAINQLGIPLITMTSQPKSRLARVARLNINIGVTQEACPLGLAPTNSSTAALVMGDAIAMILLNLRNLTKNDFARLHPGGVLGKRLLLTVNDIMHVADRMPMVKEDASLKEALIEMTSKQFGMTLIVNHQGQLSGIFTDGDIRRTLNHQESSHYTTPIKQLMSSHPKTIFSNTLATEALEQMEIFKITTLVVINSEHFPIGVIHIHDILRAGITP